MKSFNEKHSGFRKFILYFSFFLVFLSQLIPVIAGGSEVTGPEYSEIISGTYPTEVTFTDTLTSSSDGKCSSIMTDLSGPGVDSQDAHVFTAHPGERFSFRLASPAKVVIPFFTTVYEDYPNDWTIYIKDEGIYRMTTISQYLEVSDFGYDTDLSDTSANAKLTFIGTAKKIAESDPGKTLNDKAGKETEIRITAEAKATLIMLSDLSIYTCAGGTYEEKIADPLAESTGFNFKLDDTEWTVSLGDKTPQLIDSDVFQEYDSQFLWTEGLHYHTPAIILIDSDLYSRASLPTDGFDYTAALKMNEADQLAKEKLLENINTVMQTEESTKAEHKPASVSQNSSTAGRNTKFTLTKGSLIRKGIPGGAAVLALAVLTAASSAVLSSAASGSVSAVASKEEETPAVKCKINVNDGEDIPDILSGCQKPVSVHVALEGAEGMQIAWFAAVLPDPDKDLKKRLDALLVECAGSSQDSRINLLCETVPSGFHATVRLSAVSVMDRKELASKILNIKVKIPGIQAKKEEDKVKVILVCEGGIPGSAREIELREDQYEVVTDANGKKTYRLKDVRKEAA